MANRKISDLTALTAPATGDLLPIVDISEAAAADKNKKITFGELFASIPAGTAAAPGVAFEGYPGTGVYSSGADQVAIATGGTSRIVVDASGNVNIDSNTFYVDAVNNRVSLGNSSPASLLHLSATFGTTVTTGLRIDGLGSTTNNVSPIAFYNQSANWGTQHAANIVCGNVSGTDGGGYLSFSTSPDGNTAPLENFRIDPSGRLLVGGSTDSGGALLQVFGDRIRIGTAKTPASATATGTTGEIAWDANYIYVCTATNTWKRTAISTW